MPDDPPCFCPGCTEFRAIHARLCPELSEADRQAKRARDRAAQRRYEDAEAARTAALWAA